MRKINLIIIGVFLFSFISMVSVSALDVIIRVPEKYTEVIAGERFYFEIEVKYPENPSRKDLRLEYEIKNEEGKLIAQSKTLKAIETQASFIDYIIIPEGTSSGLHFIEMKVKDYETLSEEVGTSFHVTSIGNEQIKLYFFILLGAVILVGGLVVFNIKLGKRKY